MQPELSARRTSKWNTLFVFRPRKKVKYSVNYLYWAVNNSDDDEEDEESEVETTVVLPLKSLRLKS